MCTDIQAFHCSSILSSYNNLGKYFACGQRFLVKEAVKNNIPSGQRVTGLMHIADWYATFCALAGVDPKDGSAASAGLIFTVFGTKRDCGVIARWLCRG